MTVNITLNGAATSVAADRLDRLLTEQGHDPASVATAVNEVFVPRSARAETPLTDGDRVEILSPLQGG